jgi:hypothetical protein
MSTTVLLLLLLHHNHHHNKNKKNSTSNSSQKRFPQQCHNQPMHLLSKEGQKRGGKKKPRRSKDTKLTK